MAECPESVMPPASSRPSSRNRARSSSSSFTSLRGLAEAMLAQELAQVLAIDLGGPRRGGEVPLVPFEERVDVAALERVDDPGLRLLERQIDVGRGGGRACRLFVERVVDHQLLAVADRASPLDDVAQLARVPRPGVSLQAGEVRLGDGQRPIGAELADEVLNEKGNVLG